MKQFYWNKKDYADKFLGGNRKKKSVIILEKYR